RVLRDLVGQLHGFFEGLTVRHDVAYEVQAFSFCGGEHATGEHHVCHHAVADDALDAYRTAAAHEYPALGLGQAKERGFIRHANMRCRGEFEPAAEDGSVQGGDGGNRTAGDDVEDFVPGVALALARPRDVAGGPPERLGQVETGAEVRTMSIQNTDIGFV